MAMFNQDHFDRLEKEIGETQYKLDVLERYMEKMEELHTLMTEVNEAQHEAANL